MCSVTTGSGKSALFIVPILVHQELAAHPHLYPNHSKNAHSLPAGVVVTPTKGLVGNLVRFTINTWLTLVILPKVQELALYNVPALAYSHQTIMDACNAGRDLGKEIIGCEKYRVIFVDPEPLKTREWRWIAGSDTFRENLLFACAEEAHLIDQWGVTFHKDFGFIGQYCRSHFPSTISVFAITATLEPGQQTLSVCQSLGFTEGSFHLIRYSNECPDMHFSVVITNSSASGSDFPHLIPSINSGRKGIIHCDTIEMVHRVVSYFITLHRGDKNPLQHFRPYFSMCPDDYNKRTLYLLDNNPYCQCVIATVAFTNGINSKSLLDSSSLVPAKMVALILPEKGQGGRADNEVMVVDGTTTATHGIIYVTKQAIKVVRWSTWLVCVLLLACKRSDSPFVDVEAGKVPTTKMDHSLALLLTKVVCFIAFLNRLYQNPPREETMKTCIEANWPLPCSLCLKKLNRTITFVAPPLSQNVMPFPPIPVPKKAKQTRVKKISVTEAKKRSNWKLLYLTSGIISGKQNETKTITNHITPSSHPC